MSEKIFYVCDRKKCGKNCPNKDCFYTTDIIHAIYSNHSDFDTSVKTIDGKREIYHFEKIRPKYEIKSATLNGKPVSLLDLQLIYEKQEDE